MLAAAARWWGVFFLGGGGRVLALSWWFMSRKEDSDADCDLAFNRSPLHGESGPSMVGAHKKRAPRLGQSSRFTIGEEDAVGLKGS